MRNLNDQNEAAGASNHRLDQSAATVRNGLIAAAGQPQRSACLEGIEGTARKPYVLRNLNDQNETAGTSNHRLDQSAATVRNRLIAAAGQPQRSTAEDRGW